MPKGILIMNSPEATLDATITQQLHLTKEIARCCWGVCADGGKLLNACFMNMSARQTSHNLFLSGHLICYVKNALSSFL